MSTDSVTALDYLESQLQLEREARELMPYEPDTCTYPRVLRQQVFACLTCLKNNNNADIGVCYLCLIQCHSTHDLVELFSRRNFVCDCGTTRMQNDVSCALRYGKISSNTSAPPRMCTGSDSQPKKFLFPKVDLPPAEDIPSLENTYNQNFQGRFCSCALVYSAELETRTMHQCFFGEACGEDWYHQDCILGFQKAREVETDLEEVLLHFPDLESFSEFICWRCVSLYPEFFSELAKNDKIVFTKLSHFESLKSAENWPTQRVDFTNGVSLKRQKVNDATLNQMTPPYLVFLPNDFRSEMAEFQKKLPEDSKLRKFFSSHRFFYENDPIYEPSEYNSLSPEGTLFDLGSSALQSLPVPHAIEGLQAYDAMKKKLSEFFKDFVDNNKIVTEQEVKDFFGKMKEEK